jgi:hypothetical protein
MDTQYTHMPAGQRRYKHTLVRRTAGRLVTKLGRDAAIVLALDMANRSSAYTLRERAHYRAVAEYLA